ncbi:unnamed protein product, partial [Amoebophrya sp. A120]
AAAAAASSSSSNKSRSSKRLAKLIAKTSTTIFTNVAQGLFERHKTTFSFCLAVSIHRREGGNLPDKMWNLFVGGAAAAPGAGGGGSGPSTEENSSAVGVSTSTTQQEAKDPELHVGKPQ